MKRYQLTSNLLLVALILATTGAASGQVRVEEYPTVAGTLKLVGTDMSNPSYEGMAVYVNDRKLFDAEGNPPELHALFREYRGDVAVVAMCANGGCLYRVIEIPRDGAPVVSEEFGFARVERVAIAHEYGQQNAITLGNERYVLTALP